eukprot:gene47602-58314_t
MVAARPGPDKNKLNKDMGMDKSRLPGRTPVLVPLWLSSATDGLRGDAPQPGGDQASTSPRLAQVLLVEDNHINQVVDEQDL